MNDFIFHKNYWYLLILNFPILFIFYTYAYFINPLLKLSRTKYSDYTIDNDILSEQGVRLIQFSFDAVSDIHLDFYASINHTEHEMKKQIQQLITNILPSQPQEILVIAGDLGHDNHQNLFFLKELKTIYSTILFVAGNHDYYLISDSIRQKYHNDSKLRINEMKAFVQTIPNVHFLEGNIIEINGVRFGGTGMWYDFQFSIQHYNCSYDSVFSIWKKTMNDSRRISNLGSFYEREYFFEQKKKLDAIISELDVIITHVGPYWKQTAPLLHHLFEKHIPSFYFFDATEYAPLIHNKVWIHGHSHLRQSYTFNRCRIINPALGYPFEKDDRKIITVHLET